MAAPEFSELRYVNKLSLKSRILRLVWGIVWCVAFRPTPRFGFAGWRRLVLRCFGAKIGVGCKIDPSCRIFAPWNLSMGNFVALGAGVDCYCVAPITLGNKIAVSQRSFLCSASHDISSLLRPLTSKPIVIGDHAWICAEAFVGPGVTVGEGSVVGARAAVFRDVAPWGVMLGNPAIRVRERVLADAPANPAHPLT